MHTPATDEDQDAASGDLVGTQPTEEAPVEGDDELVADVTFDIVGTNFAYDFTKIEVNEGDVVKINFVSEGGFHDWVVDEFDAATQQVNPGTPTSVTFVADKAGTYEFYCSVGQHRAQGMVGELIVKSTEDDAQDDTATETGDDSADNMADDSDAETGDDSAEDME